MGNNNNNNNLPPVKVDGNILNFIINIILYRIIWQKISKRNVQCSIFPKNESFKKQYSLQTQKTIKNVIMRS